MAGQAPGFFVCFPAAQAAACTVGMGFVVGDEHIRTCAHALGGPWVSVPDAGVPRRLVAGADPSPQPRMFGSGEEG